MSYIMKNNKKYADYNELQSQINELNKNMNNKVGFLDTSRVLATNATNYTATENCFFITLIDQNIWGQVGIDGVTIMTIAPYGGTWCIPPVPLKIGQTATFVNCKGNIFSLK